MTSENAAVAAATDKPDIAMTVECIDAISGEDPERAHTMADSALLGFVPAEVAQAYLRLMGRCAWWAAA